MNSIITVLILTAVIGVSRQQIERCLLSRLDYMPCLYQNKKLESAGLKNEYSIHYTNLRRSPSGGVECNVRAKNQKIINITDLGTDDMKILYSPGFIISKEYDYRLLVQYNIQCEDDQLAFFSVTDLDIQGAEECVDPMGHLKCQDYIRIDRGSFGSTEICGNAITNASLSELQSGSFTVFFRSSEDLEEDLEDEVVYKGFQMYVLCFRSEEADSQGCLRPSDFDEVCNGISNITEDTSDVLTGRRRRQAFPDGLTYGDLFSSYPSGLRVREDVAKFHSQWQRYKRQAGEDGRFIQRLVLFNESVNYTDQTIHIADSDNIETGRYEGILTLQTFDVEGKTTSYIGEVETERYPHFFGPGPMRIAGRNAYFQLFAIDPRGLIPTPEEEEDLENLTRPLLDAIPDSLDTDFTEPPEEQILFPFLVLDERKKREVDEDLISLRRKRQDQNNILDVEVTDEAVFLALRSLEACNPVLRSQARANLQIFRSLNETKVEKLQNFTISCTLVGSLLNCSVDDGFAPALNLNMTTYCTIKSDNMATRRLPCNPFYEIFNLGRDDIISVTVESINCKGQRVEHMVTRGG